MAINLDTQDLINFPGNIKRVTIDQTSVVPQGYEGDEQFLLKFATTAYSDNDDRTAIQDLYISEFKTGWCKSSGFAGTDGKFDLSVSANKLKIKLDSTVSGTGSGYYEVTLDYNDDGSAVGGEAIASDLETEIRALADNLDTADVGHRNAFLNCSVEYKDGKFWVVSGTAAKFYTGANKTYVDIMSGATNDASVTLGFDLKTSSSDLASVAINEALVTSGYTISSGTMIINRNTGAVDGDCFVITDRTNTDYFQLIGNPVGGTILSFDTAAISNNYIANEAKVQVLREQDPDADPTLWLNTVDKIERHGVKCIINVIDYSD